MKHALLSLLLFVGAAAHAQTAADSTPARKHPTLPAMVVTLPDSVSRFNTFDLPDGRQTLLFLFSPDCEHCGMDADSLVPFLAAHPQLQAVAVSIAPLDAIRTFLRDHHLEGVQRLTVGQDAYTFMPRFYGVKYFPYFALYGRDKKLVETWDGGVKWSELRRLVR